SHSHRAPGRRHRRWRQCAQLRDDEADLRSGDGELRHHRRVDGRSAGHRGMHGGRSGIGAARVAASHFSVMIRSTSQLFVAGPRVVKWGTGEELTKEELGGSEIHAHGSGAVDNEVESEDEALAQIRRYLSYLPQNIWQVPPYVKPDDKPDRREEELIN